MRGSGAQTESGISGGRLPSDEPRLKKIGHDAGEVRFTREVRDAAVRCSSLRLHTSIFEDWDY
jgi:hypothetical protein